LQKLCSNEKGSSYFDSQCMFIDCLSNVVWYLSDVFIKQNSYIASRNITCLGSHSHHPRVSWLLVSFLLHVKYTVSYRILLVPGHSYFGLYPSL